MQRPTSFVLFFVASCAAVGFAGACGGDNDVAKPSVGTGDAAPETGGGPEAGAPDAIAADAADSDSAGGTAYDLDDVSFLYPLPATGQENDLIALTATGARGALLPASVFAALGQAQPDMSNYALDTYRVVGVRVDPCLPSTPPPSTACAKEIRLSAQPLTTDPTTQGVTTEDAAIHLFYDLDDATWADVLARLAALKAIAGSSTSGVPLGVHPTMQAQGLTGAYAQALAALVLADAGDTNLVRVAYMVAPFDQDWFMGTFERSGSSLSPDAIPRLDGGITMQLSNTTGGTNDNVASLQPPPSPFDLQILLDYTQLPTADIGTVTTEAHAALSAENPSLSNRVTIDCATCHVATRALDAAQSMRGLDASDFPERFSDPSFNLTRTPGAADALQAQRGFGYFGAQTAFSQRTINESAVVAKALSQ